VAFRRRSGFTLIELLVVIAIIAILAAMLFPVFARARESARKIQCLSNVKNIATAVQMYLTDYDRFPAKPNHDADLEAFFATTPGGRSSHTGQCCNRACQANPYGRWPVVLDEYVKNRDVWRCPSAKVTFGPGFIVPQYTPIWWHYLQQTVGEWGTGHHSGGPCYGAYPPGWGGTVTDSIAQQAVGSTGDEGDPATNAVELTIGLTDQWPEMKMSQVNDPSYFVVGGDATEHAGSVSSPESMFTSLCGSSYFKGAGGQCSNAQWSNCAFTQNCGLDPNAVNAWVGDPSFRSKYTRHLGGSNVAFVDGHASWWAAEAFMAKAPYCDCCTATNTGVPIYTNRPLQGLCPVP